MFSFNFDRLLKKCRTCLHRTSTQNTLNNAIESSGSRQDRVRVEMKNRTCEKGQDELFKPVSTSSFGKMHCRESMQLVARQDKHPLSHVFVTNRGWLGLQP